MKDSFEASLFSERELGDVLEKSFESDNDYENTYRDLLDLIKQMLMEHLQKELCPEDVDEIMAQIDECGGILQACLVTVIEGRLKDGCTLKEIMSFVVSGMKSDDLLDIEKLIASELKMRPGQLGR